MGRFGLAAAIAGILSACLALLAFLGFGPVHLFSSGGSTTESTTGIQPSMSTDAPQPSTDTSSPYASSDTTSASSGLPQPVDTAPQSVAPASVNLADLENLGDANVGRQTVRLGGMQYVSSLEFSADRDKMTDAYDIADAGNFTHFKTVIGVPGDSPDYRNFACDVTFTDQAGRALYPMLRLPDAAAPQTIEFSVAGVSKLQIVSIWESNDGTHYVKFALGTPTLS